MKNLILALLKSLLFVTMLRGLTMAEGVFPPSRKAIECTPRTGLPNFFAKAAAGGEYKIAYLGGSITAQSGYRVKSLAYFNQKYPNCKFSQINAAIGGTGSDLGVLRIDHDVFQGKPDLLFVEFAVNDSAAQPADIVNAMEGIVRKTWRKFPSCDICFVYTFQSQMLKELQAGVFNRSAATMEVIADYYGIPTIHMGLEAVRLEGEGKLIIKVPEAKMDRVSGDELNQASMGAIGADGKIAFSKDGTHPYIDTGHQLYMEAIERSIPVIITASTEAAPHVLSAPYATANHERSVMLSIDAAALSGPWTKLSADDGLGKQFANRVDSLWKAEPSAALSFSFKGSSVTMYDLLGPGCGQLEITIDGKVSTENRIDGHSSSFRLSPLGIGKNLDETVVHTVTVKVLPDKIDKSKILSRKNGQDLANNPAKYAEVNWYPGAIFIIGELIK